MGSGELGVGSRKLGVESWELGVGNFSFTTPYFCIDAVNRVSTHNSPIPKAGKIYL
ncbi:hypothetical protein [Tolypothrix sp. VBCCA 56010]|uniref:hypothetical protein n=1 Tax=Tolypothrix sp. VBCCA 56010 TaxID=3137731 RepID=UPI003D7E33D6